MSYVALPNLEAHRFSDLPQALLALNPYEKWSALRQFGSDSLGGSQWFMVFIAILLIVLVAVFVKVGYNRIQDEKARAEERFLKNVRQHHLSVREYQMLREICAKSGLRHQDAILTDITAFERGSALVLVDQVAEKGQDIYSRVQGELAFLKDKLGFTTQATPGAQLPRRRTRSSSKRSHRLTTRNIPVDKPLTITRRLGRTTSNQLRATIVENFVPNFFACSRALLIISGPFIPSGKQG